MSETSHLTEPIQYIKGVGPRLATLFQKKGISTLEDALYFLPRKYEDRRKITPIHEIRPFTTVTAFGKVQTSRWVRKARRRSFEATLGDERGIIHLFWFNAFKNIADEFQVGRHVLVHGEVRLFQSSLQMAHPEYETVSELSDGKPRSSANFGRIIPIYSETEGLNQKRIRSIIGQVIKLTLPEISEAFSDEMLERLNLPPLRESILTAHFPKNIPVEEQDNPAVQRIIFEEFFVLQLGLALKKQSKQKRKAIPLAGKDQYLKEFLAGLPFELTEDQQKALKQIKADIAQPSPMARLIQGDVGSGKTVVALAGAAIASNHGYQAALMVPTEVLAQQHYKTLKKWLEPIGIPCGLVAQGADDRREVESKIRTGEIKVVVGTHALFQQDIHFEKLALVIVDEQHRFGVEQRNLLLKKSKSFVPHLLMMSATPIPRSLALTLYGDLDMTLIRQKPVGRKPITTSIIRDKQRPRLYQKIRKKVASGEQVYIIYPLIEASEKLELKSATEMYQRLNGEVFPEFKLALLHGRMKSEEKENTLREFSDKKFQILISTTVIEVGIDNPNATLMVIEHPERLGLSQLHQLRGRVGRGELASECLLVAGNYINDRLHIMTETEDGFKIAEEDLKLRGPGEFLGTRQHGLPGFRVGHILRDADLLALAKREASKVLQEDPDLSFPQNTSIRKMVESRWKDKIERLRSG